MKTIQEQINFFNKQLLHQTKEADWDSGLVCTVHEGKSSFALYASKRDRGKNLTELLLAAHSSILEIMQQAGIEPRHVLENTAVENLYLNSEKKNEGN